MICSVCEWVNRWFEARYGPDCDRFWARVDTWEREQSNESDLWSRELGSNLELIEQASAVQDTDPHAAFRIYLRAADAGSLWADQMVAWHYHTGTGVAADFGQAQDHYRRAICAGSWMSTIAYAQLLAEHGYFEASDQVLEDGMRSDFVPAYFWYARRRYQRSRGRASCAEIRPLLDYASGRGHPGAQRLLAALMMTGKYGLRQIPIGFRAFVKSLKEDEVKEAAGTENSGIPMTAGDHSPAEPERSAAGTSRYAL